MLKCLLSLQQTAPGTQLPVESKQLAAGTEDGVGRGFAGIVVGGAFNSLVVGIGASDEGEIVVLGGRGVVVRVVVLVVFGRGE